MYSSMAMGSVGNRKKCHSRGLTEERSMNTDVHEEPWSTGEGQGNHSISSLWVCLFALSITSCPVPELGLCHKRPQTLCFSLSPVFAGRSLRYCAHLHLQYKMSKEETMFDTNPTLKNSLSSRPLWRSRRGKKGLRYFLLSLNLV